MNTVSTANDQTHLEHALAHAEHLLPSQRPLEAFVHHNTLHAFEGLPFEQAVVAASRRLGARPYVSEAQFRAWFHTGRIQKRDLQAVVATRVPADPIHGAQPGLDLRAAVMRWMRWVPPDTCGPALAWRLAETDLLQELPTWLPRDAAERFQREAPEALPRTLRRLWEACAAVVQPAPPPPVGPRPRDRALAERGADPDQLVHPVLVRWCMAYLDNGQAWWPMPDREEGFYRGLLRAWAAPRLPLRGWMRPLRARAQALLAAGTDPAACAAACLRQLGVPRADWDEVVTATLLALPGWPGMFVQLDARPDLAPGEAPPTQLVEFLAVRLLLDQAALEAAPAGSAPPAVDRRGREAWRLFHQALLVGLHPDHAVELPALDAQGRAWDVEARLALWQLAYERRYRVQILDALRAHHPWTRAAAPPPRAQVITCIDDREESLRRALEELDPAWETLGAAGFFGVPMAWKGLREPRARPLCPAGLVPQHLVEERPDPAHAARWEALQATRARTGRLGHIGTVGSGGLLQGGLLTLAGLWSLLPLASRLIAPAQYARAAHAEEQVPTCITLERDPAEPQKGGRWLGFSVEEMARIVGDGLRSMGLVGRLAPLVAVLGHGSSSMNNPHEAAYACGACGGGHGGPSARVFAAMANHPGVRALLQSQGLVIPAGTTFLGGAHNTATDTVEWYDLDQLPPAHRPALERLQLDLERVCALDAQERCRRFELAPLNIRPEQALQHVQDRAEDLAQPRPELGHATNAACLVGRRAWSRGLFLDRRAFLVSYDSRVDSDGALLEQLLGAVVPVGAGINLEYWFSFVDSARYGCGSKLPHNVVGLLGVMEGHASDLRTGLPWQMVEIHEPVRLLMVVEATPARLLAILERQPGLRQLVVNRWVQVVAFDPDTGRSWFLEEQSPGVQGFVEHQPEELELPAVQRSVEWFGGKRGHLPPATVLAACPRAAGEGGR